MRHYPCAICNGLLNHDMCQSGIRVEGKERPAHVACADAWYSTEIEVYKVTSPGNGSYYEEFAENVAEVIKEMEQASPLVIEKKSMTRGAFESLEEFKGF